jgi:RNA polymerase sigma-70 factor (ECF subfamily)
MSGEANRARFTRLYQEHYRALLAYALRRCDDRAEAQDVVADSFLILWRRLDEVPEGEEAVLWLFGVARRVLANRKRKSLRQVRLAARLAAVASAHAEDPAAGRREASRLVAALQSLREEDREVLLLAAWEELSNAEIGRVLGCSENAATLRLHRARRRLTEVYKKENDKAGDKRTEWPRLLRRPKEGEDT